jgi:hypothetical protein
MRNDRRQIVEPLGNGHSLPQPAHQVRYRGAPQIAPPLAEPLKMQHLWQLTEM